MSHLHDKELRWGVLGTAKIARTKVIPAIQRSALSSVVAIASRTSQRAKEVAEQLDIPKSYGSYEDLLGDADIDAVYIPVPNHLHVPLSLQALEAGKHVLCEKPIATNAADAEALLRVASTFPELRIMEAFMYRFHEQWKYAREIVSSGRLGPIKTVHSMFSYHNVDDTNVRNVKEIGGGGLLDIGCYCISLSRFIFGKEPIRAFGILDIDPSFGTDRAASGILDFGDGTATFTCSTQMAPFQHVLILGTEGRLELDIPFNAPRDRPCRLSVYDGPERDEVELAPSDQFLAQVDAFARSVLDGSEVPTPLDDAVANMKSIDAVQRSAAEGTWIEV